MMQRNPKIESPKHWVSKLTNPFPFPFILRAPLVVTETILGRSVSLSLSAFISALQISYHFAVVSKGAELIIPSFILFLTQ